MSPGFSEFGLTPAKHVMPVPAATPEVVALLTSGLTASIGGWLRCRGRPLRGAGCGLGGSLRRALHGGCERRPAACCALQLTLARPAPAALQPWSSWAGCARA